MMLEIKEDTMSLDNGESCSGCKLEMEVEVGEDIEIEVEVD